jgi:hypothetical protein
MSRSFLPEFICRFSGKSSIVFKYESWFELMKENGYIFTYLVIT